MKHLGKLAFGALLMAGTAIGATATLSTPASAGVVVGVGVPAYPYYGGYPYYGYPYYGYPYYGYGYGGPYIGVGWGWRGGWGCCGWGWRGGWGGWHGGYGGWRGGYGGFHGGAFHGGGFHGPSAVHVGGHR